MGEEQLPGVPVVIVGETVRLLVVDDHPVVLQGVTLTLQDAQWVRIAGYARTGRDALAAVETLRPDVVLLDLRLPDMLGPECISGLKARSPGSKIILFTAHPDHVAVAPALKAGASAVVAKDVDRQELMEIIRRVIDGEIVSGVGGESAVLERKLRDYGLARREYEILRYVAMGKTNPEIADQLGLTKNTVKTYLQRAMEKLGAHNRVEAISRASQIGIL